MTLPATFGAWMKERRTSQGMTLRDCGPLLGASYEQVRMVEAGKQRASLALVVAAAEHWRVNAWELLAYYGLVPRETLIMLLTHPRPETLPVAVDLTEG